MLFAFAVLALVLQYYAKRLAGKNVSNMTCFVLSGMQYLNWIVLVAAAAVVLATVLDC